jgi:RNA polymerase sigma-70 factor (ECF subfamily)
MLPEEPFADLMAQLRAGDENAATRIFNQFSQRLIALARSRLDAVLRQKVDPEDILQSVFRSFFTRHADGKYELENWDSLWGLLVVITLRKCGRKVAHFHGAHHDARKETALPSSEGLEILAREATPIEAAILAETVEQLLRGLTERERRIVEMRLQGYTAVEIGAAVGRTEHTVHWVLKRVRKSLQQYRHLDDA